MEEKKKIRNKWLHIRFDEDEFRQLNELFSKSTEKKIGRYARRVILHQPLTIIQRNGSLDELIAVLTKVQQDLNGVANNFNQMVHKLHMTDTKKELLAWLSLYEREKHVLFESIDLVKSLVVEGAKKWLR